MLIQWWSLLAKAETSGQCIEQMWSPISPNLCNSEEKRLHCSPQAQSYTLVPMIGANGPQAAFSKCARMRGGQERQLPLVEEEPQDVGPELGFGNGNESFEGWINRAPATPLPPWRTDELPGPSKGSQKVWHRQIDFCIIIPVYEIRFEWWFYFYFFQSQSQKVNPILNRWTSQGL